jgi:hypothetical protein
MPMRGELPDAAVQRCVQSTEGTGRSVIAAIWSRDVQVVAMFAAIGILTTINAVLYFPDFGATLARLAVFP